MAFDPNRAYVEIHAEARSALHRFGPQLNLSEGDWLAILTEEVGEVARHISDYNLNRGWDHAKFREELVQVGAMALRWLWVIDQRGTKHA